MSCHGEREGDAAGLPDRVMHELVAGHREFVAFVERRVGDRTIAEDVVQDAFVKGLERGGDLRADESSRAWFYRVLRNAIIDHHRRAAAAARRDDAFAQELPEEHDEELQRVACKCVGELAGTLKPEYATALRRIEVDGVSVKDYAGEAGISSNNAGVRIFRAREALRKQVARSCGTCATHGCVDCSCKNG